MFLLFVGLILFVVLTWWAYQHDQRLVNEVLASGKPEVKALNRMLKAWAQHLVALRQCSTFRRVDGTWVLINEKFQLENRKHVVPLITTDNPLCRVSKSCVRCFFADWAKPCHNLPEWQLAYDATTKKEAIRAAKAIIKLHKRARAYAIKTA